MTTRYSIYSLVDPRTRTIRYVGVTKRPLVSRLADHFHDFANEAKCFWFDELRKVGSRPRIQRLAWFFGTWGEALAAEVFWMNLVEAKYGAQLVNMRRNSAHAKRAR